MRQIKLSVQLHPTYIWELWLLAHIWFQPRMSGKWIQSYYLMNIINKKVTYGLDLNKNNMEINSIGREKLEAESSIWGQETRFFMRLSFHVGTPYLLDWVEPLRLGGKAPLGDWGPHVQEDHQHHLSQFGWRPRGSAGEVREASEGRRPIQCLCVNTCTMEATS